MGSEMCIRDRFLIAKKFLLLNFSIDNQKEVPIEKLNSLVLSSVFLSIGIAYEKDIGPITVNISNEIPTEDLISRLFWLV